MKEVATKLGKLAKAIASEKGELSFFGLALREDASVWDLLVAAEWIEADRKQALSYLAEKVQSVLSRGELLELSGIVLLDNKYFPGYSKFESETGWEESNINLYGLDVKKAYIFVASDAELQFIPYAD